MILSLDESRLRRLSTPPRRERPVYFERFGPERGPARLSRRARDEWRSDAWHLARRLVRRVAGAGLFLALFVTGIATKIGGGW